MANRKAALVRLCKTPSGWRRYPVALKEDGQIKPDRVIAHNREMKYETGHYEIRYYQSRQTKYDNVGNDPGKALEALHAKVAELQSIQDAADGAVDEFRTLQEPGTVNLPSSLLERAEAIARKEGVTLDVWISAVIGERVGAIDAERKR